VHEVFVNVIASNKSISNSYRWLNCNFLIPKSMIIHYVRMPTFYVRWFRTGKGYLFFAVISTLVWGGPSLNNLTVIYLWPHIDCKLILFGDGWRKRPLRSRKGRASASVGGRRDSLFSHLNGIFWASTKL